MLVISGRKLGIAPVSSAEEKEKEEGKKGRKLLWNACCLSIESSLLLTIVASRETPHFSPTSRPRLLTEENRGCNSHIPNTNRTLNSATLIKCRQDRLFSNNKPPDPKINEW